jgi:uncharacterized small protein (DUF1192 family)
MVIAKIRLGEMPQQRKDREDADRRRSKEESARQAELSQTKAGYARLKSDEVELVRLVNSVTPTTNVDQLAASITKLDALHRILASFPEKVRESYRTPETSGERGQREMLERLGAHITMLQREIERITKSDITGLDMRLNAPITEKEFRAFPGDPAPHERHYALLREQRAAKLADIERHREEIARLQSEIARIEGN